MVDLDGNALIEDELHTDDYDPPIGSIIQGVSINEIAEGELRKLNFDDIWIGVANLICLIKSVS